MKIIKIDGNGWKLMKVDETGWDDWKWMEVDESGQENLEIIPKCCSPHPPSAHFDNPLWLKKKQARKLQATLVRNYDPLTRSQGWSVELLA